MTQAIESLLANLNSKETLQRLACFTDPPRNINDINFRIGLSEGPQIKFLQETQDQYNLAIRDEKGLLYEHPVILGSDTFAVCQEIRNKIIGINSQESYRDSTETEWAAMLSTLINQIAPIFIKLEKRSDS